MMLYILFFVSFSLGAIVSWITKLSLIFASHTNALLAKPICALTTANPSADPSQTSLQSHLSSLYYPKQWAEPSPPPSQVVLSTLHLRTPLQNALPKTQTPPLLHPPSNQPSATNPLLPHNPHTNPHPPHAAQTALPRAVHAQRALSNLSKCSDRRAGRSAHLPASEHSGPIGAEGWGLVEGAGGVVGAAATTGWSSGW